MTINAGHLAENGHLRCVAKNLIGSESGQIIATFSNKNLIEGLHISYTEKIEAHNRLVLLTCGAPIGVYTENIAWFKDGKLIESSHGIDIRY